MGGGASKAPASVAPVEAPVPVAVPQQAAKPKQPKQQARIADDASDDEALPTEVLPAQRAQPTPPAPKERREPVAPPAVAPAASARSEPNDQTTSGAAVDRDRAGAAGAGPGKENRGKGGGNGGYEVDYGYAPAAAGYTQPQHSHAAASPPLGRMPSFGTGGGLLPVGTLYRSPSKNGMMPLMGSAPPLRPLEPGFGVGSHGGSSPAALPPWEPAVAPPAPALTITKEDEDLMDAILGH